MAIHDFSTVFENVPGPGPLALALLDLIRCDRCAVVDQDRDAQTARANFYATAPDRHQEGYACDWAASSALAAYGQGFRDALALFQADRLRG